MNNSSSSNQKNQTEASKDVNRAQLDALDKEDSTRVRIRSLVDEELRKRYPFREDWQKKCKEMAKQLEEVIFRNAKSLEEYSDEKTLSLRLVEVFMAKRKKEIAREREAGDEVYNAVLDKAQTRWLGGEEIVVLLMKCSRKLPSMVVMNDPAFLPPSGTLYHFSASVAHDGYNWLKTPGTDVPQQHRFILTVGGHPRVWVSLNVDIQKKMHRRTYWLADHSAVGVLVHYLSEVPVQDPQPHLKTCFCLSCLFKNREDGGKSSSSRDSILTSSSSFLFPSSVIGYMPMDAQQPAKRPRAGPQDSR